MKKFIKKLAQILAVISICVILCIVSVKAVRFNTKLKTFQYVKSHSQQLTLEAETVIEKGVHTHHQYEGTTVIYYPSANYPIVEFSMGGFGIAPAGYYTGFYYSPEDIPVRYNGSGTAMEEHKNGWTYQEKGDNGGYTEKICDNWYWYKFWY